MPHNQHYLGSEQPDKNTHVSLSIKQSAVEPDPIGETVTYKSAPWWVPGFLKCLALPYFSFLFERQQRQIETDRESILPLILTLENRGGFHAPMNAGGLSWL